MNEAVFVSRREEDDACVSRREEDDACRRGEDVCRGARMKRVEVGTKNLSQNPPFWEEKVGGKMGHVPTLFSFPTFFPLPFSLLTSRGN